VAREGALVAQLEPNSPAAKGGIEAGDVLTSVNGEAVKDSRDLARKMAAIAPGTATNVGIFRNGQEKTITVTWGTPSIISRSQKRGAKNDKRGTDSRADARSRERHIGSR